MHSSCLVRILAGMAGHRRPYPPLTMAQALAALLPLALELPPPVDHEHLMLAVDNLVINFQSAQLTGYFNRHVSVLHPKYGFRFGKHPLFQKEELFNKAFMDFRQKLWNDPDGYGHLTDTDQLGRLTYGVTETVALNLRTKALKELYRADEPLVLEALTAKVSYQSIQPDEVADNHLLQHLREVCTPRELQVVELLAQEKTRNDIADSLGISRNYVDQIIKRIRDHL